MDIYNNRFYIFTQKNKSKIIFFKKIIMGLGALFLFLLLAEFLHLISLNETIEGKLQIEDPRDNPYVGYDANYRDTKNRCSSQTEGSIVIFTFGGSTMWGSFVDYTQTIPSYLSKIMCDEGFDVEVKNYGQLGYVSRQGRNLFLEVLEKSSPDIVIFYDGANDSIVDEPGKPEIDVTADVFDFVVENSSLLTRLGFLLKTDLDKEAFRYFEPRKSKKYEGDEKYEEIVESYLHNVEIINSISNDFDFEPFFYWQPSLATKSHLSKNEKKLYDDHYEEYLKHYKKTSQIVGKKESVPVRDLTEIFTNYEESIYYDDCHKNPIGNKLIAEKMAEDLINYLNK